MLSKRHFTRLPLGTKLLLAATTIVASSPLISIAAEFELPDLKKKEEVFIEADNLEYDHENGVVTATGKVEIIKGGTALFADKILYNQKTDEVIADGNVSSVSQDGSAIFVDRTKIKGDFKEGVIEFFRAKLSDGSQIAAASAERVNENKVILEKAVYSPCPICEGQENPQWQIKSKKVTYDKTAQKISYKDAFLEVYGVPIMYAPFFSHPTPDADAKSGFLPPKLRTDSNLGGAITVPYYWNISPSMDITFEPVITTKEGLVAAAELRHLTEYGEYKFSGSITRPRGFGELGDNGQEDKDEEWRGHLKGSGNFDITENWDFGFDGEVASDDTYLRRYNYSNKDLLTSRAYMERIKERDYSIFQTVYFQGLLEQDVQDTIPYALPYFRNHYETEGSIIPEFKGSKLWADFSGFAVNRDLGQESQRVSITGGGLIPFTTNDGHIFEVTTSLRADQYHFEDGVNPSENEARLIPEASLAWRYPLVKQLQNGSSMLLEPQVKIIASSNNDYNEDIPNEDSQDVEFSDLNFFSNSRYRGLDRVESGTRAFYGLRGGYYSNNYDVSYVVGQNYQISSPDNIPVNTGISDNLSDYVGRVSTTLYDTVDLSYKFRFDKDALKPRRHEVDLGLNYHPVKANVSYFFLDYDFTNQSDNREEINGNLQYSLTDEWSVLAGGTRNINDDTNINARIGALYEGECTNVLTTISRDYVDDRDAKSGTSFNVQIGLKNMGQF